MLATSGRFQYMQRAACSGEGRDQPVVSMNFAGGSVVFAMRLVRCVVSNCAGFTRKEINTLLFAQADTSVDGALQLKSKHVF